jgi:hypothetical protein
MYTGSKSLQDRLTETLEIEKPIGKSPSRAKPTSENCSALQSTDIGWPRQRRTREEASMLHKIDTVMSRRPCLAAGAQGFS